MGLKVTSTGAEGLGLSPAEAGWLRLPRSLRAVTRVLSVTAVALFSASVPVYYRQVSEVCAGSSCAPDQVSPRSAEVLADRGVSLGQFAFILTAITIAAALLWFVSGFLIARARPRDTFAHVAGFALVLGGAFTLSGSVESGNRVLQGSLDALNVIEMVVFLLFIALFPNGRFVPRWTGWIVVLSAITGVAMAMFPSAEILGPLWFPIAGSLLGAQVYRYVRVSNETQRRQTRLVLVSLAVVLLVIVGMFLLTERAAPESDAGVARDLLIGPAATVVLALLPVSIGLAILRHQLFEIDVVVRRTIVYGVLTVCVVLGYVLIVGYLGALFRTDANLPLSIVATGAIAVIFAPLRDWVQGGVNRLMYGQRNDPYEAMAVLVKRLDLAQDPRSILEDTVRSVRDTLRLPYVAIDMGVPGVPPVASGEPGRVSERITLHDRHVPAGSLIVSPRPGEAGIEEADRRLLGDLAGQIGVVVNATRLMEDLQAARERLVTAHEEERRRLRRNLHDGLGPQLASQMLLIDAAMARVRTDPDVAEAVLGELKHATQESVREIRTIVQNLRPAALDDLGLVGALRQATDRMRGPGQEITLSAPDDLPPLPAAVEVAAYHIAREGLTNAVRHAQATTIRVVLDLDPAGDMFRVTIDDDGLGLEVGSSSTGGTGVRSMRERVAELGGDFHIRSLPGEGTRVCAAFPLEGPGV